MYYGNVAYPEPELILVPPGVSLVQQPLWSWSEVDSGQYECGAVHNICNALTFKLYTGNHEEQSARLCADTALMLRSKVSSVHMSAHVAEAAG